jgi:hypothetical protein
MVRKGVCTSYTSKAIHGYTETVQELFPKVADHLGIEMQLGEKKC